jgi:hypothetical protein
VYGEHRTWKNLKILRNHYIDQFRCFKLARSACSSVETLFYMLCTVVYNRCPALRKHQVPSNVRRQLPKLHPASDIENRLKQIAIFHRFTAALMRTNPNSHAESATEAYNCFCLCFQTIMRQRSEPGALKTCKVILALILECFQVGSGPVITVHSCSARSVIQSCGSAALQHISLCRRLFLVAVAVYCREVGVFV